MKRAFFFAALLTMAACGGGAAPVSTDLGPSGTLRLTLSAATQISNIDSYTMKLVIGGHTSTLQVDAPQPSLPPSQTLDVDLHGGSGTVDVTIEADDATGKPLANGSGSVEVDAGKTVDLAISLQPV
jgi:hypothetical protein